MYFPVKGHALINVPKVFLKLNLLRWVSKYMYLGTTVVPVMNGHPRDQANVSVHCRWPLIRGNLTLKCVGRGTDNVAVQCRWPLTTGVAQGRYYCILTDDLSDDFNMLRQRGICYARCKSKAV